MSPSAAHGISDALTLRHYLNVEMFRGRQPNMLLLRAALIILLREDGRACVGVFRISQALFRAGWRRLAGTIGQYVMRRWGCTLHPDTPIALGLRLPHPQGIVIGRKVTIGRDCTIYQQVTIGGRERGSWGAGEYPVIGDGCTLWAGAKIIGTVHVGNEAVVGANAVVTRDVPAGHVALGVPAISRPSRTAVVG